MDGVDSTRLYPQKKSYRWSAATERGKNKALKMQCFPEIFDYGTFLPTDLQCQDSRSKGQRMRNSKSFSATREFKASEGNTRPCIKTIKQQALMEVASL